MEENLASNFIFDIIDDDLASGREDHVHTRFPPEPHGMLHIGSAKAIYINYTTAKKYGGLFNLRMDDTNPSKENEDLVRAIHEDLVWLTGEEPSGGVFYGSDYFDRCFEYAVKLIRDGKAYVCDLSADEMREYRGTLTTPGRESPWRNRSVEENLDLFYRMRDGEFPDGAKTLRAKIDMASPNMNLRDPAIYRILHMPHHRQGDKWCIYPLYDFAHPIQDATEGITHSLCSIEFADHRVLYDWVVDNVGIEKKPHQYEFARLNLTYTVMSKRYLRSLVEAGIVDGWDDPRLPTLAGMRRRGYTPSAIFDFVRRAGISKTLSLADAGLLEHCIREELNKTALRRVAVLNPLKVTIVNYPEDKEESVLLPNNPEDPSAGMRALPFTREIYIDREDFAMVPPPKFHRLSPGKEVRLMGSYIIKCEEAVLDETGEVKELLCTADLETGSGNPVDGRKVRGVSHWLSATLENVSDLPEDKTYNDYFNPASLTVKPGVKLEPSLQDAKPGEKFQFVRVGYFTPDSKHPGVFNRVVGLKDSFAKSVK